MAGDEFVQLIDQPGEFRRAVVARTRQLVLDDLGHPPGVGSEKHDTVGHERHLADVVADHDHRRQPPLFARPDVDHLGAKAVRRQRVDQASQQ